MGTLLIALLFNSIVNTNNAATSQIHTQIQEPAAKEREFIVAQSFIGEVTGYSSTPDQTDDTPFVTATGEPVYWGIVATNSLPFNTKVRFPELYGDKIFIVKDRMHERYVHRFDIWFPQTIEAKNFGIKNTTIEIVTQNPLYALAE